MLVKRSHTYMEYHFWIRIKQLLMYSGSTFYAPPDV